MRIRLVKACKDLNVGISRAVEFLASNGFEAEVNPNYKISTEEYNLLAKEFNKDKMIKTESNKLTQQRNTKEEEKQTKETTVITKPETPDASSPKEEVTPPVSTPQKENKKKTNIEVKKVGYIDLDNKNKTGKKGIKTASPQKTSQTSTSNVTPSPKEKIRKDEIIPTEEIKKEEIIQQKTDKETAPQKKTVPQTTQKEGVAFQKVEKNEKKITEEKKQTKAEKKATNKEEIYTLKADNVKVETPNVLGKIDLTKINQKTRPKSKTRAQKQKEREERIKQQREKKRAGSGNATTTDDKPKNTSGKRKRINPQKVDITKAGNNTDRKRYDNKKGRNLKKRPIIKTEVSEEDVQRQVKETLARLTGGNKGKAAKNRRRRDKVEDKRNKEIQQSEIAAKEAKILKLTEFVTVSELASMMDTNPNQIIATCMTIGLMVSINMRLDAETINIVAEEFGYETSFVSSEVLEAIGDDEEDKPEDLQPRAPIVTVMGHVDHGKTSLLDYIRNTNVIAGEAGGITQHIGAYNVKLKNGQRITFLDTPGHEAFTAMRARGAKVTDIAIIIIAADDDVMPQTVEAINHASAANVPIVFAINKIDSPNANPHKIKERLANMNYMTEEWGGKYQSQDISAKKGEGIYELLEKVLLEAEMLELTANPKRRALGSIIESSLDKGRGYVSTILIENGTLKHGDTILAGTYYGKIKAMFNERNQRIQEALPSEPAIILGLDGAPQAGDNFNVMATEQEAREIANKREQLAREQSLRTSKHFTLEELGRRIALGDFQELNIIVKGDVDGSIEALSDAFLNLSTDHIQVNVIHKAVGAISDSDILLAAASNAIICGFQVRPTVSARRMAEKEEIDIRLYSIIYDAIEELKAAMEGMLSPEIKEEITASIEVLEVFKITKVGTVAGSIVREGKVKRGNNLRLIRDGIVVYTGEMDSLKHAKDDVKEMGKNMECGIRIKNFNDIKVGDIIESFEEIEVKQKL